MASPSDYPLTEPDYELGFDLVWRLLNPQGWIRRRVETITFLDADTMRRSVSVDLDVPEELSPVVPLARLQKAPLMSFDLRDEAGGSMSAWNTGENGHAAFSALMATASLVLGGNPPGSIAVSLHNAVYSPALRPGRLSELLRAIEIDERQREVLFTDPVFTTLLENLSAGFLLLTRLPSSGPERRVLKYAYSGPFEPAGGSWLGSLGLIPRVFGVSVPLIADCQSYHLECQLPEDLVIASASIEASSTDAPPRTREVAGQGNMVHLFLDRVTLYSEGRALISVCPAPSGMLRATVVSIWTIIGTLAAGALWGDHFARFRRRRGDVARRAGPAGGRRLPSW